MGSCGSSTVTVVEKKRVKKRRRGAKRRSVVEDGSFSSMNTMKPGELIGSPSNNFDLPSSSSSHTTEQQAISLSEPRRPILSRSFHKQRPQQQEYHLDHDEQWGDDPRRASRDERASRSRRNSAENRRESISQKLSSDPTADQHQRMTPAEYERRLSVAGSATASTLTGSFSIEGPLGSRGGSISHSNASSQPLDLQLQLQEKKKRIRRQRRGKSNDALLRRCPSSATSKTTGSPSFLGTTTTSSPSGTGQVVDDDVLLSMLGLNSELGGSQGGFTTPLGEASSTSSFSDSWLSHSSSQSLRSSLSLTPSEAALRDSTLHEEVDSAAAINPLLMDYGEWEEAENATDRLDNEGGDV